MSKDNTRYKSSLSAFIKLREQEANRLSVHPSPGNDELHPISELDSKLGGSLVSGPSSSDSESSEEDSQPGQKGSIIQSTQVKGSASGVSSPNYISANASPSGSSLFKSSQGLSPMAQIQKFPGTKHLPHEKLAKEDIANTPNYLKEYRYKRKSSQTLVKEDGNNESKEIRQMNHLPFVRGSARSSASSQGTTPSAKGNTPVANENKEKDHVAGAEGKSGDEKRRELEMQTNVGSCMISDSSEEEEELTPRRKEVRKKIKKSLHVAYFLGILFSMKNRVKIYGALRSIEHVKQFETSKPPEKKKSFLPLMPTDNFTILWTIMLVVLLILTAVLTPYRVSFIEDDDAAFQVIDLIFDIWFGIDMLINFVSAYNDPVLGLVTNLKMIILRYLKTWFWIDFVAILPFDDIILWISAGSTSTSRVNKLLRLLRFPRLYRLLKILRLFKMLKIFNANQSINRTVKKLNLNVGIMKIMKVLINILFLNHLVSCIWFFVARVDDFNPETWVARAGLVDSDAWSKYVASYYWAFQTLTTVGFGDIPPKTFWERMLSIVWMVVGVGFYSFTIGNLSTILANIDKKSAVLKNKLTAFNNFAIKVKLPEFLRQKIQRFFELNHKENVYYWMDPQEMLKELPANLRTSLLLYSYYAMIKNIRLLQLDANFTASVLTHLKLLKLKKGETLYREGDPAEEVYFISKGAVKLVNEYGQSIYALTEGTYFGEVETLNEEKRICFCQATESTILLVCERESFLESLKDFPTIEMQIQRTLQMRKTKYQEKMNQVSQKQDVKPEPDEPEQNQNKRKLMKSTEYFNKVIVKYFSKEKRASPQSSPGKPKKSSAKVHIDPTPNASLINPNSSSGELIKSFGSKNLSDVEFNSPSRMIKKSLETVNEEKLSATSPGRALEIAIDEKVMSNNSDLKQSTVFRGLRSPKEEEMGLLDESKDIRPSSLRRGFFLGDPTSQEDHLQAETWRRFRNHEKSTNSASETNRREITLESNRRDFVEKRGSGVLEKSENQEVKQEPENNSPELTKQFFTLVPIELKNDQEKTEAAAVSEPTLGNQGGNGIKFHGSARKLNNWFNIAKARNFQDDLGEVKEENFESLSISLKGSRIKLEDTINENKLKVPNGVVDLEEVSEVRLEDLDGEDKKSNKREKPKIKLDNLVEMMANNMLQDENSEHEYELEGEDDDDESRFEEIFQDDY